MEHADSAVAATILKITAVFVAVFFLSDFRIIELFIELTPLVLVVVKYQTCRLRISSAQSLIRNRPTFCYK